MHRTVRTSLIKYSVVYYSLYKYGSYFDKDFKFYCFIRFVYGLGLCNSGTEGAERHPVVEIKQISGPYVNVFILVSKLCNRPVP